MAYGDYANSWTPMKKPSEINSLTIRAVFSKWCPPNGVKGEDPPCWQDDMKKPPQVPYPYSEYSKLTGRECPVIEQKPWMPHFAQETCNLFEDHFSDNGNCITHWCSDANVTRTELGVLEYLNIEMDRLDGNATPIFHIVVNTHDWPGDEISLDLAFPSNSYYSPNLQVQDRFVDDTLFVREYRKGNTRDASMPQSVSPFLHYQNSAYEVRTLYWSIHPSISLLL